MTTVHPIKLLGDDISTWEEDIPRAINTIFNPYNSNNIVKDIIKLDKGTYIITFNTVTNELLSLFRELYYDTSRIILTSTCYYDISIADKTKHKYIEPNEFKTSGPYENEKYNKPFILYKKNIPRRFPCELNEVLKES